MDPVKILTVEHGLIRQFLSNVRFAMEKMERGERPPAQFFEHVVVFARDFVDAYHHFKEELQLFALLAQKHGGQFDAPIEALRNQHEHGRSHITRINDAIPGYEKGNDTDATVLLESMAAYLAMLRQHIHREDHVFFPMAREVLSDDEMHDLLKEYEKADEKAGEGFYELCRERVLKMEALLSAA